MKKFLSLLLTSLLFISTAQAKDFRFVQVSEAKYDINNDNTNLQNVIKDINKQKNVEFVVFSGDNINRPSEANLEGFLEEAKKLKRPYYVIIGDKDVNKLKSMSKDNYSEILKQNIKRYKPETPNYSFKKKKLVFIVVDGAKEVIPTPNGYYRDTILEWLDNEIAKYPKNNIIILQHFPVIPPAKKENYYTYKAENYMNVIAKHKNIKAIISGHFGVNDERTVNGIRHISTNGVPTYRIIDVIDYESEEPTFWAQIKNIQ